ncbi:MAG TPA: Ig domain-containing protein [Chthoniobacterales bacterium]|nr:Ig domain-containing protein [Chthoniobacterales bacterium]
MAGDGRGCNQSSGSFTINEIVYGTGNTIVRFDAAFSQRCENTGPPLTGRVLFNSTNPLPPPNRIISELTVYATAGQPFNYQVRTSKPNTAYSAENLPPELSIHPSNGLISGTPNAPGSYQVALSASGADGTATATLNLTIDPPGRSTGLYTALEMRSDPGDFIGQGKTTSLRPADGIFSATSFNPGNVRISFRSQDFRQTWDLSFAAPSGSSLGVGLYPNAMRFASSSQPGLDVSGNGRGSNNITGSFEVKEIAFDGSGKLKTFHASFIQHSEGAPPALTGTVWFQSPNAITSKLTSVGKEGQPFAYQIIANNQPSAYSATGLPAGLSVDPETGLISGTSTAAGLFRVNLGTTGRPASASDVLDLTISPAQSLVNVSTRLKVGTGNNVLIGGFIITGSEPKRVIVRAIGPSLSVAGVPGALSDPNLELFRSGQLIAKNDDWRTTQLGGSITQNQRAEIQASGVPPTEDN